MKVYSNIFASKKEKRYFEYFYSQHKTYDERK